jgi:hypothetical protein
MGWDFVFQDFGDRVGKSFYKERLSLNPENILKLTLTPLGLNLTMIKK